MEAGDTHKEISGNLENSIGEFSFLNSVKEFCSYLENYNASDENEDLLQSVLMIMDLLFQEEKFAKKHEDLKLEYDEFRNKITGNVDVMDAEPHLYYQRFTEEGKLEYRQKLENFAKRLALVIKKEYLSQ